VVITPDMDSFFELDIFYPRCGNCRYLLHVHHPYKAFILMGSLARQIREPILQPRSDALPFLSGSLFGNKGA
jgi:hypothetical protein